MSVFNGVDQFAIAQDADVGKLVELVFEAVDMCSEQSRKRMCSNLLSQKNAAGETALMMAEKIAPELAEMLQGMIRKQGFQAFKNKMQ